MEANEVEVPKYFICPISLQIMKDPVTTVTGITYDRSSIERWMFNGSNPSCPVTKQPLSKDSGLTPNHTLRRLIQTLTTANASIGVDRIATPKAPLEITHFIKLLQDIWVPQLRVKSLKSLAALASESERNRQCMEQAGVVTAMMWLITDSFKEQMDDAVEDALDLLHLVHAPLESMKALIIGNCDFVDSLTWVLLRGGVGYHTAKIHALLIMKPVIETAPSDFLGQLKVEFFEGMFQVLREGISLQATKTALRILLAACWQGRNRMKIIDCSGVFQLIELQLAVTDTRCAELGLFILDHLCAIADGRAQLLGHAAGLAIVAKKITKISATADDCAVGILSAICKFSATDEVIQEMLRVGAVAKLCIVLQVDCSKNVKDKAMGVLKMHSNQWKNSPCIDAYLLSSYS